MTAGIMTIRTRKASKRTAGAIAKPTLLATFRLKAWEAANTHIMMAAAAVKPPCAVLGTHGDGGAGRLRGSEVHDEVLPHSDDPSPM